MEQRQSYHDWLNIFLLCVSMFLCQTWLCTIPSCVGVFIKTMNSNWRAGFQRVALFEIITASSSLTLAVSITKTPWAIVQNWKFRLVFFDDFGMFSLSILRSKKNLLQSLHVMSFGSQLSLAQNWKSYRLLMTKSKKYWYWCKQLFISFRVIRVWKQNSFFWIFSKR